MSIRMLNTSLLVFFVSSFASAKSINAAKSCSSRDLVQLIELNNRLLVTSMEIEGLLKKQLVDPKNQDLKVYDLRKKLKTPESASLQKSGQRALMV